MTLTESEWKQALESLAEKHGLELEVINWAYHGMKHVIFCSMNGQRIYEITVPLLIRPAFVDRVKNELDCTIRAAMECALRGESWENVPF